MTNSCPFCRAELVKGICEMRPFLGLFGSTGPTDLEFIHDLTEYDALVRADRKVSYFCERCGAAIILDEEASA